MSDLMNLTESRFVDAWDAMVPSERAALSSDERVAAEARYARVMAEMPSAPAPTASRP